MSTRRFHMYHLIKFSEPPKILSSFWGRVEGPLVSHSWSQEESKCAYFHSL